MLGLINAERATAGVDDVALGDNVAAQPDFDAYLANCSSSQGRWDGLKPYMRYGLAGGYQSNAGNGHQWNYCINDFGGYAAREGIRQRIEIAMALRMDRPGHRRNILDPTHRKVNIGLA